MFSRILVPVDASEPAQRAVDLGGHLAGASRGHVKLLHVINPTAPFITPAPTETTAVARQPEHLLARLRDRIADDLDVDHEVLTGVPAERIVDVARRWNADLVVVGDRNRRGLSRFRLGSVADAVVRQAPCSVLVVREKDGTVAAKGQSASADREMDVVSE
jgi:nucleotide-binding universal stress UspA family protein